eukprot:2960895-Pleurochrysis_carterae.AAC.2
MSALEQGCRSRTFRPASRKAAHKSAPPPWTDSSSETSGPRSAPFAPRSRSPSPAAEWTACRGGDARRAALASTFRPSP